MEFFESINTTSKFYTPDETINYFFATHLATAGTLAHREPLNATFTNPIVFMRWMQSPGVGSALLYPGTFLGFIVLAAGVATLFGVGAVVYITPLLAVGAVLLMYWILRMVASSRVALVGAAMLALFPPFFYYASRTMFHTVPFLFFVLLGIAAYLRASNRVRMVAAEWFFLALSALGFCGALFIRFADIWWIGGVVAMLLLTRSIGWKKAAVFVGMCALGVFVNLLFYKIVYGNWFTFGYPIPGFSASDATTAPARLGRFVVPFGFYPRLIWQAFVEALWRPYLGMLIMATLGFVAMAVRYWAEYRRVVLIVFFYLLLTTSYILSLYGSWSFSDSPTPGLVTIGSSYTRYFLPVLVMGIPFAAYLVTRVMAYMRSRIASTAFSAVAILCFGLWSWALAYAGEEGLAHVRAQTREYQLITHDLRVLGATADDIFLVRRGEDKILFPEFPRVINVDYLPEEMVRKNLENFSGAVWVSEGEHIFKKRNPYRK